MPRVSPEGPGPRVIAKLSRVAPANGVSRNSQLAAGFSTSPAAQAKTLLHLTLI